MIPSWTLSSCYEKWTKKNSSRRSANMLKLFFKKKKRNYEVLDAWTRRILNCLLMTQQAWGLRTTLFCNKVYIYMMMNRWSWSLPLGELTNTKWSALCASALPLCVVNKISLFFLIIPLCEFLLAKFFNTYVLIYYKFVMIDHVCWLQFTFN
jgi:hypothetical protein